MLVLSLSLMASSSMTISFRPAEIRACATPGGTRKSGDVRRRSSWWSPLFGWPSEADYIDGGAPVENRAEEPRRKQVAFTEEKARELRMRTIGTETFHDVMYHSAIASRLASDLPRRSDL